MTARAATAPPARGLRFDPERGLQLLLVFVPIAVLAEFLHWGGVARFVFAAIAIVPLAAMMGEATERIAGRLGAGVGGLLNATFGNAAELIIAVMAMRRGLYDVVKASLTGSVIGNVLLVLGLSCLFGGIGRERQRFDRSAASAGSTLLAIAAVGLLVPAVFHGLATRAVADQSLAPERRAAIEGGLSLEIAILLFVVYLLHLLFSLHTHRHLFAGQSHAGAHDHSPAGVPIGRAVITLLLATVFVAWMSELLVGAVEEASHALGLTEVFVGVIVVAVIGNAAEHSTAVLMALRDQMDLALNIAIGSSLQIALFVAPLLVFVSRLMPHGPMDLVFTPFEVLAVGIAVGLVTLVASDGESNWLEGAMLVAVYAILGVAFFFLP